MLQYQKVSVSEGIDIDKASLSKETETLQYWIRCILWGISRNEIVNRLNNSVLEDKGV